ncbi:hypothetical protein [Helicobacter ailurogastricus]|uniref:hypothetical protein n=1 Tax=Helicobacter ailurogastricus TaxID=1578720 RepID=UPI0022C128EF|nr:hypothetical protein [Helicobacter ailurogastricus]GLH58057.1 hypothetical protein NHP214376_08460 [Helicobacter ailurogastricus]GLH59300.1 hypothetical protein NHP214377_05670 [Helicobacter ailurogastricus]
MERLGAFFKVFVLACCVGLCVADEFVLSYRVQTHNGIATNEAFGLSRALKKHPHNSSYTCDIPVNEPKLSPPQQPYLLDILLKSYQNAVVDCLYKGEVLVQASGFNSKLQNQNQASLDIHAPASVHLEGGLLVLEIYEKGDK